MAVELPWAVPCLLWSGLGLGEEGKEVGRDCDGQKQDVSRHTGRGGDLVSFWLSITAVLADALVNILGSGQGREA